ncbi:hypothetical protein Patl1_31297 [Pistacia atlantica]|uniref:Uncharacterized protein n=1 Tax=Pistacia atlantica TaxID=434234 RepID=A0ACC1A7D3_9ROSI|nr:hypothetical protein Patl1_31297 [Pistacia atlantica]
MALTSVSLSPPPLILSISKPKPCHSLNTHNLCLPFTSSPLYLSTTLSPSHRIRQKIDKFRRRNATSEQVLPSESTALETSEQIVSSTGDDGVSNIISILLFVAFIALTILTIGVVYIAVTDFLQKREKDKFEKEEAAKKKKKGGKKVKVRARAGPKGFGQKIDDFDDD